MGPQVEDELVPRLSLGVFLSDCLRAEMPSICVRRLSRLRSAAAAGSVLGLLAAVSEHIPSELHAAGALRACLSLLPAFLPHDDPPQQQAQSRARSTSRASAAAVRECCGQHAAQPQPTSPQQLVAAADAVWPTRHSDGGGRWSALWHCHAH